MVKKSCGSMVDSSLASNDDCDSLAVYHIGLLPSGGEKADDDGEKAISRHTGAFIPF